MAAYLALHKEADQTAVEMHADLQYGEHELQNMDIFTPQIAGTEPLPVVVYIHGGGLTAGDKISPASEGFIYSNIPIFFARNGMIGINANYRLVPEVSWPSGADDLQLLMQWIREQIGSFGGDPDKIFFMCNSAGCNHVATYLFSGEHHFADGPGVAGALLASGAYTPDNTDYFGTDAALTEQRSVSGLLAGYEGPQTPLFLWTAELDEINIELSVANLFLQLCQKYQDCPEYMQFPNHNHVSDTQSFNTADTRVSDAVLDFIHRTLR